MYNSERLHGEELAAFQEEMHAISTNEIGVLLPMTHEKRLDVFAETNQSHNPGETKETLLNYCLASQALDDFHILKGERPRLSKGRDWLREAHRGIMRKIALEPQFEDLADCPLFFNDDNVLRMIESETIRLRRPIAAYDEYTFIAGVTLGRISIAPVKTPQDSQ